MDTDGLMDGEIGQRMGGWMGRWVGGVARRIDMDDAYE